jgi:hypothetical protein
MIPGGLAEFEREFIYALTGEGREHKAQGENMGRPSKLIGHQLKGKRSSPPRQGRGNTCGDRAQL